MRKYLFLNYDFPRTLLLNYGSFSKILGIYRLARSLPLLGMLKGSQIKRPEIRLFRVLQHSFSRSKMNYQSQRWRSFGKEYSTVSHYTPVIYSALSHIQGYWMSDKPLVQQALSSELAELLLIIPSNLLSLKFLMGFWQAIVREWNGIDRLRYAFTCVLITFITLPSEWTNTICSYANLYMLASCCFYEQNGTPNSLVSITLC